MNESTATKKFKQDVPSDYQPRTEFGRRMWELRQQILASGRGIETLEELEHEIADGRGGISEPVK
jgi:hypothetical protein